MALPQVRNRFFDRSWQLSDGLARALWLRFILALPCEATTRDNHALPDFGAGSVGGAIMYGIPGIPALLLSEEV
jgi:hypothetical protein